MIRTSMGRRVAIAALAAAFAAGWMLPASAEPQPHMAAALAALKNAETELAKATPDKGGHRVKALGLVRSAIKQVETGIKVDNRR